MTAAARAVRAFVRAFITPPNAITVAELRAVESDLQRKIEAIDRKRFALLCERNAACDERRAVRDRIRAAIDETKAF